MFRGAGIVITLVVGTTVLGFSEAPRADADSCLSTAPSSRRCRRDDHHDNGRPIDHRGYPPVVTSPGKALPDSSLVVAFPAIGLLIMSGYLVMHRRRNQADTR